MMEDMRIQGMGGKAQKIMINSGEFSSMFLATGEIVRGAPCLQPAIGFRFK